MRCLALILVIFAALVFWFLFIPGGNSGPGSVKLEMLRGVVNAPALDDVHESPFFVADIPGKGMGLLALRDIKVRNFEYVIRSAVAGLTDSFAARRATSPREAFIRGSS